MGTFKESAIATIFTHQNVNKPSSILILLIFLFTIQKCQNVNMDKG